MLLRTDRKVPLDLHLNAQGLSLPAYELYLNHMRRKLGCMFYIELKGK
jgi:hypothetical protein